MSEKRKKRAIKRFVDLVRGGSLSKSKFIGTKSGLSTLGTESLQAAKGAAPHAGTNILIGNELLKRSANQAFDSAGTSPSLKKRKSGTGNYR